MVNGLVSSVIGPSIAAMREELRKRDAYISEQFAHNRVVLDLIVAQTQVLTQMRTGYDKRLDEHQKQVDDHEARLKKIEALLELKSLKPTPRNGEATATAPEPRPAIPISEPAPIPMPTSSSPRSPCLRIRESTPTGWSKLSVQARELLRESALARLHHKQNALRGAIGTNPPLPHSQAAQTFPGKLKLYSNVPSAWSMN